MDGKAEELHGRGIGWGEREIVGGTSRVARRIRKLLNRTWVMCRTVFTQLHIESNRFGPCSALEDTLFPIAHVQPFLACVDGDLC